jgi:hypothetical protein
MKNIKTYLKIFIIVLFISNCAKNESESEGASNSNFSPPSWIQGAWTIEYSGSKTGWKFSSSDAYMIVFGSLSAGFIETGSNIDNVSSTDSLFSFNAPIECNSGNGRINYSFNKNDNSKISLNQSATVCSVSSETVTYNKDTNF